MVKIDKKYRTVILDFEKTLVSLNINWNPLRKTYAEIFKKYGFVIDYQSLRPIFESTGRELKKISQLHPNDQLISQILKDLLRAQKAFEHKFLKSITLFSDTKLFLESLTSHGLQSSVLTNNLSSTVKKAFSKFNISFQGYVIGREDVKYPKPDLEGAKRLLNMLQVKGNECIMIGDTDFDMEVAKKIGALAIFLKRSPDQKLTYTEPDYVISSLSEIIL